MNSASSRPSILRLVLLVSLVSCVPLGFLCGFQIFQSYQRDLAALREIVRTWRDVSRSQLEAYAEETQRALEVMATSGTTNGPSARSFQNLATAFCRLRAGGQTLSWIDPEGRLVSSSDTNLVPGEVPSWVPVIQRRDSFEVWGILRAGPGEWRVPMSVPFRPGGGAVKGTLVLLADPQTELTDRLERSWPTNNVVIMVLDPAGNVALHSLLPKIYLGTNFPDHGRFAARVDAGESDGEAPGFDLRPRLYSATRIAGTDWLLRASVLKEDVETRLWERIRRSLLLLGLSGVVAVGASRWLAGRISGPAHALAGAARGLAAGTEGEPIAEAGPLELAETARAFNEMVAQRREARVRLEASELRFRRLFENMSAAFALVEPVDGPDEVADCRFVEVNRAFETLTGKSASVIVGRLGSEVFAPALDPLIEPMVAVARTGDPFHPDSTQAAFGRLLEISAFQPQPGRVALLLHDVTERVRNREALDAVHRRYQSLLDSIDGIVWDSSTEGEITYVSPQAERILGHPVSRWIGDSQRWAALLHPADRDKVLSVLRDPLPSDGDQTLDFRMFHADGHSVWLRNLVTPVRESDGALRRLGVMFDITEQKHAEEALRENERLLQLALEGGDLGFWHIDLVGGHVCFSNRWITMLGLDPARFVHTMAAWEERIHPDDLASVRAAMRAHFEEGSAPLYESLHRLRNASGGWTWVASRGRIVERSADGRALRAAGTHLDVTTTRVAAEERAALERKIQETQKLESLGVLAGGIAHDFNNLLTGILGNASLARLSLPGSSNALDYLAEVEQSAERAAHLCRQMLAYSGRGRFVIQHLDLNTLIEDIAHLLGISIGKGVVLRQKLSRQLPSIEADVTQIRQVLMNLVINASEAIGDRSGVIVISTGAVRVDAAYLAGVTYTPDARPGDYVSVEVSDTGCGMDAETIARIFDPFFTTKFTGRGLGLAAVLGIVRGHRGAIKVYSEPGRGTSFKLLFPVADGVASPLETRPAPAPRWRGDGEVLVVDDDETILTLVARMLERLGMAAVLSGDPREAVEILRGNPGRFRVVLLDLTMPHLGGEETFRLMRGIRADVPVVLMSGFTEEDAVSRFAGKGLAGFVQKPFGPTALSEALRRVLESADSANP